MIILFKFKIWLNKACEVGENVFYSESTSVTSSLREQSEGLVVLDFIKSAFKNSIYPCRVLEISFSLIKKVSKEKKYRPTLCFEIKRDK